MKSATFVVSRAVIVIISGLNGPTGGNAFGMTRAKKNTAPLSLNIFADILSVITLCQLDPFHTLLCSIHLHFAADQKQLVTLYPVILCVIMSQISR